MQDHEAIAFIDANVHYKPGWEITAHSTPVPGKVRVNIIARVKDVDYDPATAPEVKVATWGVIDLTQVHDVVDLHHQIFQLITELEIHEAREQYRVGPERIAPFHPHTIEGAATFNRARRGRVIGGLHAHHALGQLIRTHQEGSE